MANTYSSGTAAVEAGSKIVTLTGGLAIYNNMRPGDQFVANNDPTTTNSIRVLIDNTHFELATPYTGADAEGLPYVVTKMPIGWADYVEAYATLVQNVDLLGQDIPFTAEQLAAADTAAATATTKASQAAGSATTATTQAGIATTKASEAAAAIDIVVPAKDVVVAKAAAANADANRAELAVTASAVAAQTYTTEALGRAAVANGVQFQNYSADGLFIEKRTRVDANSSTLLGSVASGAFVQGIFDKLKSFLEVPSNIIIGQYYLRTTGALTASGNYRSLEPIDVSAGETVFITSDVGTNPMALAVWLKADGTYLSSTLNGPSGSTISYVRQPVVVPANAAKLLVSCFYPFASKTPKVERYGISSSIATASTEVQAALVRMSKDQIKTTIRKILTSAQRPLGDLAKVMATPPTITHVTVDGAVSPINSSSTVARGGGRFNAENPAHVAVIGGLDMASDGRIKSITYDASGAAFRQGHGAGIAFYTMAADLAACMRVGPTRTWTGYITNTLTGVRERIADVDLFSPSIDGYNYERIAPGSRILRLWELYGHSQGAFRGIDVPSGDSIWPAVLPEPKVGFLWDSFGFGLMNDLTHMLRLGVMDWFFGMLGIRTIAAGNGLSGTGVVADSGNGSYTFPQRAAVDFTAPKVGYLDLIYAPGSINDGNAGSGAGGIGIGTPDTAGIAAVTAAYQASITSLMAAQPYALIVGNSQQATTAAANAGRAAAYKAGFMAAAGADQRMIWLDDTLWQSTPDTGVIGADAGHPNGVAGARYIGERLAQHVIRALQERLASLAV